MIQRLLLFLSFALLSFSTAAQKYQEMIDAETYTLAEIQVEAEAYFDIAGKGKGSGYKQYKRWEYVAQMELDDDGVKISNLVLSKQARDFRRTARQTLAESSAFGGDWKQLGPTYKNATSGWNPGVGRITSIGIDASNTNHLIVGSPTGGVWKSLNGGNNWVPLTDDYSTTDVYALEISPYDNNVYLWGGVSGRIYRSLDAGVTWQTTGNISGGGTVSRIEYHPTNPNIVYGVSQSAGLYRSTNGGSTWSAVTGASGMPGYDVEFKPGDPNTIYFSGRDVYRSTNGGASFTQINGFGTASNNYKMMGVSEANPNFVYVVEADGGKFGAFYKSTNSGVSYTKLVDGADINYFGYSSTGDDDKGQAPRDMDVAVSPFDANEVHIAGIHTWKSVNGGTSFNLTSYWVPSTAASLGVGYNHADIDILKFAGNTLYVGSDGGIYTSTDGAASFVDKTSGIGIRQFYKIGVSKTDPNVVSGGSQDNGSSVMRGANRQWVDWLGADGMESFVDWNNPNILYGTSQNGSMYRSSNQGNSRSSISKPPGVDDGAWVTPFEQDPQLPGTIYVAFADVWKSSNNGSIWTKISDFDNGNFSQMKLAPTDRNRIYVARSSNLYTTANGGTDWTTTPKAWGSSSVSSIAVHPLNPLRVLIVTSSGVYQSTDAGNSWTNMSAGLPSGTKYCAVWENTGKNGIYVGGFGFVTYTNDDLAGQWTPFFEGLPNVRVYELEINYVSSTIFAGTYGRGLWESGLYQISLPISAFSANVLEGCHELTVTFTDESSNTPESWAWTFENGVPASSTEKSPTVTFTGSGSYSVQLKTTNSAGENILDRTDYITVFSPTAPIVSDVVRCDPGDVSFEAIGQMGEEIFWYAAENDVLPLSVGSVFSPTISQNTTYYVSSGITIQGSQKLEPSSNAFGGGNSHAGGYYLIMDVQEAFTLKSALVYATGAGPRTFQLRDANSNVLEERIVDVPDGESRVILNMDIPVGTDLEIGCPSPADLFRNDNGVNYPYVIDDVVQIKSSTAGLNYYYYLYDLEISGDERCESPRVPVTGTINTAPAAPAIMANAATALCPGESVELELETVCAGCDILWSNGETTPSIPVSVAGMYTATLSNQCGDSPASNSIEVYVDSIPGAALIVADGPTTLCLGSDLALSAENSCPSCLVTWSNGVTGSEVVISSAGDYTAVISNTCGAGPVSNIISVSTESSPAPPILIVDGSTSICEGNSLSIAVDSICPGCTVLWSNGETTQNISASLSGTYTASLSNSCGESLASNMIEVAVTDVPEAAVLSADGASEICPGESVELMVDNLCAGCSVNWSNGATGPTLVTDMEGVYSATMSNSCGEGSISNEIIISEAILPAAAEISAAGPTQICPGTSIELSVDNLCNNCTVNWSNSETGSSIHVNTAGDYTAVISNGCGDGPISNTIAVTLAPLPETAIISVDGATTLCPGDAVQLTLENPCVGCTATWSNGATDISIMVETGGNYTVFSSNTCGDGPGSDAIIITTEPLATAPEITASGSTALCLGDDAIQLTANNLCAGCSLLWSNGETTSSISVADPGNYSAIASNVCGDSQASNAINVTMSPLFVPIVTLVNVCQLTGPAGSNHQWFLDGVAIPGATSAAWTALVAGQYTLSMVNATGCTGISAPIMAQACISNTQQIAGLESIKVYPNPAQDKVFLDIQALESSNIQVDLFASDGRYLGQIFTGNIIVGPQILELNLPLLPTGIYRYRLANTHGAVNGSLVVKQH